MILILILNIFCASTFIIGKALVGAAAPLFIIGTRMILAGSILLFYYLIKSKNQIKIAKSDYKILFLLSLIYIYIPFIFEFWALKYVSAAKTSLIYNLSPFVTAILAYLIYKEKLSHKKILGLFIGFLGFIPIIVSHAPQELIYDKSYLITLPELCVIIAVISSAYSWIVIQNSKLPLFLLNGASMLIGGTLSLITSLLFENWSPVPVSNMKEFIVLIFLIIIIGNFIYYNLYALLLKRYTATFLSFAGFTIPLFTAIMQFLFFNVPIGIDFVITLIIVSSGLYIFYQEELAHGITKT